MAVVTLMATLLAVLATEASVYHCLVLAFVGLVLGQQRMANGSGLTCWNDMRIVLSNCGKPLIAELPLMTDGRWDLPHTPLLRGLTQMPPVGASAL